MVASFASVSPFTVCRASLSKPTLSTLSPSLRRSLSVSFCCINYEMATVLFFSILLAIYAAIYLSVCLSDGTLSHRFLFVSHRMHSYHAKPRPLWAVPSSFLLLVCLSKRNYVCMQRGFPCFSVSVGLTTTHIITYAFFFCL